MPPTLPRPLARARAPRSPASWWKLIDWRLVAAVGLPLWAFVFGLMVPRKPTAVVVQGPPPPGPPPLVLPSPPDDEIPPPRAIVVREAAPVTVPVVVPVPTPEAPVAVAAPAAEFKLPAAELFGEPNKCQTFGTKIRFHKGPGEAAEEAGRTKKMMFVLHISGHFEDPGFT